MPTKRKYREVHEIEETPPTRQQPYRKTHEGRKYQEIGEAPPFLQQPHREARDDQPKHLRQDIQPPPNRRTRFGAEPKAPFLPDRSLNEEDRMDILTTTSLEIELYNRVYDYWKQPNPSHILPWIEGKTWRYNGTFCRNPKMLICCPIFRNQVSPYFITQDQDNDTG